MIKKLVLSLALLGSFSANAEFISGADIAKNLKTDRTFVLGYVAGVTDSVMGITSCPPKDIKLRDIVDIMVEFMSINLDKLESTSADMFITVPLSSKFPCPRPNKQI